MPSCFRDLTVAVGLALFAAPGLFAQNDLQMFPLSQVRQGLKGIGRTVFEGDKIEEFQVEILGVLKNALAPKQDLILARLSGGPLAETGVIAGMSGSPVYIDGKLLGAVALGFAFSKEPIAGITPIEQMTRVVPEGVKRAPPDLAAIAEATAPHNVESGGFSSPSTRSQATPVAGLPNRAYRIIRGPGGS